MNGPAPAPGLSELPASPAPAPGLARPRTRRAPAIWSRAGLVLSLAMVALIVAVVLFPQCFTAQSPSATDVAHTFAPPSSAHLFGTDQLGRDVYARVVYGARISVAVGAIATVIGVVAGCALGLVAAAGSRLADAIVMRLTDVWLAFPGIMLALLIIALIGTGSANSAIAIGVASAPYYARLVRGQARAVSRSEFVEAATVLGVPPARSALRHILPNIGGPVVVLACLGTGTAIISAAGLGILGLGPPPPTPEWGATLAAGESYLGNAWWIAGFPGLAIVVVVLSVTMLSRQLQARSAR